MIKRRTFRPVASVYQTGDDVRLLVSMILPMGQHRYSESGCGTNEVITWAEDIYIPRGELSGTEISAYWWELH